MRGAQQVGVEQPVGQVDVWIVRAVHAQGAREVAVAQLPAAGAALLQVERIEGLLVLAPAGVADEALVVPGQALPADAQPRLRGGRPLHIGLVELGIVRVHHRGIGAAPIGGTVELLAAQVLRGLDLDQAAEMGAGRRAIAQAHAQGHPGQARPMPQPT